MPSLKLAAAVALIGAGLGLGTAAQAAPAGPGALSGLAPEAPITTVAGGCGPGWHRGPYGGCRPGMRRGYWGPPRYYARRCWVRATPWGPRRVCR